MDIEIQDIIERSRPKVSLRQKVATFFRRQVKRVTWKLWGRRRAIARMRQLAGLNPRTPPEQFNPPRPINIVVLAPSREPIPPPDADDVN